MRVGQADLDSILNELVDLGRIKRTELGADKQGRPKQKIALI